MRTKSERKERKRELIVVGGIVAAALVLASAVLVGSGAVFTATSANPENVFTAGTLSMDNSEDNAAILSLTNMKPGDVATGSVTIANTGTLGGGLKLALTGHDSTVGPNKGDLFDYLLLKVTYGATSVYDGTLAGFKTREAGTIAAKGEAGDSLTYDFEVTFPDGNTPGSDTTGDNAYQGSATEVEFTWTAVQS